MILAIKCLRDFYECGYWNAIQFGYIPDFNTSAEKTAYCHGYRDGKNSNYSEDAYLGIL